jgi:hypothetical protein
MAAYLNAYELLGDPKLLDIARRYFDGILAMQFQPLDGKPPDGAWLHTGASHGDGNGWTTSPWMSALLMDSIWKWWMIAGDPRCPASLAAYAKFAEKHAVTADGRGVWYMANSPDRGRSVNPESPPTTWRRPTSWRWGITCPAARMTACYERSAPSGRR